LREDRTTNNSVVKGHTAGDFATNTATAEDRISVERASVQAVLTTKTSIRVAGLVRATECEVEEEDEARGQAHRLNTNEVVSEKSTEHTANEGESDGSKTFHIALGHSRTRCLLEKLLSLILKKTSHTMSHVVIADPLKQSSFFPLREQGITFLPKVSFNNAFS